MSLWKETVITDSGMLPNPAHTSLPSLYVRDYPGQLPGPTGPQASLELQPLLSAKPTRSRGRSGTGSLARPGRQKAQGQPLRATLIRVLYKSALALRQVSHIRLRYFSGTKWEQRGEKGTFFRFFPPPNHLSLRLKSHGQRQLPLIRSLFALPRAARHHPPQQWVQVKRVPGWWQMETFF